MSPLSAPEAETATRTMPKHVTKTSSGPTRMKRLRSGWWSVKAILFDFYMAHSRVAELF